MMCEKTCRRTCRKKMSERTPEDESTYGKICQNECQNTLSKGICYRILWHNACQDAYQDCMSERMSTNFSGGNAPQYRWLSGNIMLLYAITCLQMQRKRTCVTCRHCFHKQAHTHNCIPARLKICPSRRMFHENDS